MTDLSLRRIGLAAAAPVMAVLFALIVSSIVLELSGSSAFDTYEIMLRNGFKLETMIDALNRATPLFIAGVAAAFGFRMNLFNIGIEGQYVLAAFVAAVVGANVSLPGPLHVGLIMLTAVFVGAAWAGLAGLLKVTRGINEVISTIMLNFIAIGGIIAATFPSAIDDSNQTNAGTPEIAESGWLPDLNGVMELFTREIGKGRRLTGMLAVAIILGVAFHILVNRSRFGFDLRASGMNPWAARAGGVPPARMVLLAMLLSGAVAGLIGMPEILSDNHSYDQGFIRGLGFGGIGVALLGRQGAPGMAVAALLFGFLDSSSAVLQVQSDASASIVVIMQAVILLAAVVAYEVVSRIRRQDEIRRAALTTAAYVDEPADGAGAANDETPTTGGAS
jgi:simple sugar transport system permease protein